MALFRRKHLSDDQPTTAQSEQLPEPPAVDAHGLRSLADHRAYLLSLVDELPPFGQQLMDAVGLRLCEDIVAGLDLPGFDNSAMDGYAVHANDVALATDAEPVLLPVVGAIAAGESATHPLAPGTAMKIMTGAPLPPDADAVVAYEGTDRGAEEVLVYEAATLGQHIRRQGEDVAEGDTVLHAGALLNERAIGLLAAVGVGSVLARPRPRVVVIATGSELVEPGLPLARDDQIYDSNSFMLAAAAREAGAQVFRVGMVPDDPERLKQLISDQLVRADLLITCGGVSQGDHDIVKAIMPELGLTDFASVAVQPGKPQGFGLIGTERVPVVMVPGNPVSAFVSFEAFVRPLLRKMSGVLPYVTPPVTVAARHYMAGHATRDRLARGRLGVGEDGRPEVEFAGGHGSHLIGELVHADCLVHLPAGAGVAAGDDIDVWPLDQR